MMMIRERAMQSRASGPRSALVWALRTVTALGFAASAAMKFSEQERMQAVFEAMGAGTWLMYVVAALEVAGAVGLLLPRFTGLAALCFVTLMAGALATHAVVGGNPGPAIAMFCLASAVAWLHRRDTTAFLAGISPRSFVG